MLAFYHHYVTMVSGYICPDDFEKISVTFYNGLNLKVLLAFEDTGQYHIYPACIGPESAPFWEMRSNDVKVHVFGSIRYRAADNDLSSILSRLIERCPTFSAAMMEAEEDFEATHSYKILLTAAAYASFRSEKIRSN